MESEFNKVKKAKNENTPQEVLNELLKNENEDIKRFVITNKNFSENMQIALATDINTPVHIMYALGISNYVIVRNCLAANKNCPLEIIEKFIKIKDALMGVASNVCVPTDILESIIDVDNGIYQEFLSANPRSTEKILEQLHAHYDVAIRKNIALNPSSTEKILVVLASDISIAVRSKVSENEKTPLDTLKQLMEDNSYISAVAQKNYNKRRNQKEKREVVEKALSKTSSYDLTDEFMLY